MAMSCTEFKSELLLMPTGPASVGILEAASRAPETILMTCPRKNCGTSSLMTLSRSSTPACRLSSQDLLMILFLGRQGVKSVKSNSQRSKPYERSSFLEDSPLGATPVERTTPPPPAVEEGPKLYVGNLPWTCDSQQLAEIFQDCGTVELVEVIYDRETSRSRGFGFVTMASQAEASAAKQTLDGYMLGGRSLTVSFPQSNRDRPRPPPRREFGGGNGVGAGSFDSGNKLFVGNLSWGVDDASLQNMFSRYGTVVDARVVYDRETGRSRGFGFVTLSNAEEVNEAIQNMDGADFDGRQIRVNLAGDKPPPRIREY
ncbi:unnamed protein product [Sphagnum jensenii]|uniref:RRM domain-containing protein n=1 Tax=Sphagnum jensenii TaxID=128206 RepID=A0ABP1BR59_9BRYO